MPCWGLPQRNAATLRLTAAMLGHPLLEPTDVSLDQSAPVVTRGFLPPMPNLGVMETIRHRPRHIEARASTAPAWVQLWGAGAARERGKPPRCPALDLYKNDMGQRSMVTVTRAAAAVAVMLAMAPGLASAQGLPNSLLGLLGGNGVSQDQAVHQAYQQGFQDGFRQAQRRGDHTNRREENRSRSNQDNYDNGGGRSGSEYQGHSNNGGYSSAPR
jgi:hypothetical protein